MLRAAVSGCMCSALLVLAACEGGVGSRANAPDLLLECQFEINPPGSYEAPAGVAVPVVTPGPDGTADGADALNACIRQKAKAFGITNAPAAPVPEPVAAPAPQPAPVPRDPEPTPARSELPRSAPVSRSPNPAGCPPGHVGFYRGTLYCNGG